MSERRLMECSAQCRVQLSYPVLRPAQYNGSWFVIARKAPSSRSFLPANVNSSMIRLQVDGEERLNMTEYHSINGTCMPPLYGVWTKKGLGYFMELRTENGHLFSMGLRGIYHDYSGEQNEEMNMVIYGCSQDDGYAVQICKNSSKMPPVSTYCSSRHLTRT
ncbi:hypothetical protein OSTOST_08656, partial [Ostertagia ostertagi]